MGKLSAIIVPWTSGLYQLASYMTGRFHWRTVKKNTEVLGGLSRGKCWENFANVHAWWIEYRTESHHQKYGKVQIFRFSSNRSKFHSLRLNSGNAFNSSVQILVVFLCPVQKYKDSSVQNCNVVLCFVWVWNLVCHIERRTLAEVESYTPTYAHNRIESHT